MERSFAFNAKDILNNKNIVHFGHILNKAIDQYVIVKEKEVRQRIEESEQRYTFDIKPEQFYNEYDDETDKIMKKIDEIQI